MSTETATNPGDAGGVAGQGDNAPSDDIDTEAFDRVEAPEDVDPDAPPADAGAGSEDDADPDKPKPAEQDDDHVEVEHDGQKHRVPKALKDAFLRQADYTRKTTELAQAARSFEEQQQAWESQREESRAALPEEYAAVAILKRDLAAIDAQLDPKGKGLGSIDWEAYRRNIDGLASDDPERVKYTRLRDAYMALRDDRIDLTDRLGAASNDLSTKETERLAKQQEAQEAALAKQRQETGRALAAEVEGWSPERMVQVVQFMNADLGIEPEEISKLTDVRTWKLVDAHMKALAENQTLKKALKQQETANGHAKAQQTKPAETTKGGGGQARDPSKPGGDGLGTETWMERRRKQVAAKRR